MKVNYLIIIIIIMVLFISCKQNKKREFYKNGALKKEYYLNNNDKLNGVYLEYFQNGTLKEYHIYREGKKKDSSLYYYKNGNVRVLRKILDDSTIYYTDYYDDKTKRKEGSIDDKGKEVGIWKFYTNSGFLDYIREYKIIDESSYLNQEWNLDEKGDTLKYGSNYFKIFCNKDTLKVNEVFKAVIVLDAEVFTEQDSELLVTIPFEDSIDYDIYYKNRNDIKVDTFISLIHDVKNQKWFKNYDYSKTVVFGKKFNSIGKKTIRGILSEFYIPKQKNNDSIIRKEHLMFFEKEIYVIDENKID